MNIYRVRRPAHADLGVVQVLKSEGIEMKRRSQQTFRYADATKFIMALTGKREIVVYVGQDDGKTKKLNPSG